MSDTVRQSYTILIFQSYIMHNIYMTIFMPIYEQRMLKIHSQKNSKIAKYYILS